MPPPFPLAELRQRIAKLERPFARPAKILPFGIPDIDIHLPEGGLARGALHEIAGGEMDAVPAAGATLFVAGILARLAAGRGTGCCLWCAATPDLFPPGLACAGLHPDRLLHVAAPNDKTVLLVMEEALRHPGLAAVVGEIFQLSMTASRRLALAAEKSGVMALALRRRRETRPEDTSLTAAATRWRITPLPAAPGSGLGMGRARQKIELTRCRGGQPGTWIMEACDAQGRLALPALSADRSAAKTGTHA